MPHAIGLRSYLGIGFQSAHGVAADVLSAHWLPFVTESLVEDVPRIDSGELRLALDEGYTHQGLRRTAGDIVMEPTPFTLAVLGYAAMGAIETTSVSGSRLHTITGIATEFSQKFALPPFTVFMGRDCGSYTVTKDFSANNLSFTIANGELLKATLSVIGGALDSKGADYSSSVSYLDGNEKHMPWNITSVSLGGSAAGDIINGTVSINNNLEAVGTIDGSNYAKRLKRSGRRQFRMDASVVHEDLSYYSRLRSEASQPLVINMHTSSNNFVTFGHGAVAYEAAPMNISGPGPVTANVNLRGLTGFGLEFVCKTDVGARVGSGSII